MNGASGAYPGPIATAAANAQANRRRTSITALGLGTSPNQSFFGGSRNRAESWSTNGNGSIDESAIEDGDAAPPASASPTSGFGRRLSFGARALRDSRTGAGNGNGRSPTADATSPPPAAAGKERVASTSQASAGNFAKRLSNQFNQRSGEGFTWSEQLRSRAERSSSITTSPTTAHSPTSAREPPRSAPVPAAEPPPPPKPAKKQPVKPDHFQERILKGDFYMD